MAKLLRFHDAVVNDDADVAKEMLDAGLDPNDILAACWCQTSCGGYSLLYMACQHGRMTIVKMLLMAGADPDGYNEEGFWQERTPFFFAAKSGNTELLSLLLRESKVHGNLKWSYLYSIISMSYGWFREFHDDEDAIKAIGDAAKNNAYERRCLAFGNLLHGAAKHRSSKLCNFLLEHCGIERAVDGILLHGYESYKWREKTETISYIINMYGARNFVENKPASDSLMAHGSRDMLEMLMVHFYQFFGSNKALWTELMVSGWRCSFPKTISIMHHCAIGLFRDGDESKFTCLLRWGVYSVLPDLTSTKSMFYALAKAGNIESARVLINLYPQFLQEQWLLTGCKPWLQNLTYNRKAEEYFPTLVEKRQHAPSLQILCRSVIFHSLGINPIPKAVRLPLPRILKDFVQCKELFGPYGQHSRH